MSRQSGDGVDISLSASGDAQTWLYHFVKFSGGDRTFDIATGGSAPAPIGVLQDDPRSGDTGAVRVAGTTQVVVDTAATAIAVGDWLTSGSEGRAIVTTGSAVMGQALEAVGTGTACAKIEMLLMPFITDSSDNTP